MARTPLQPRRRPTRYKASLLALQALLRHKAPLNWHYLPWLPCFQPAQRSARDLSLCSGSQKPSASLQAHAEACRACARRHPCAALLCCTPAACSTRPPAWGALRPILKLHPLRLQLRASLRSRPAKAGLACPRLVLIDPTHAAQRRRPTGVLPCTDTLLGYLPRHVAPRIWPLEALASAAVSTARLSMQRPAALWRWPELGSAGRIAARDTARPALPAQLPLTSCQSTAIMLRPP